MLGTATTTCARAPDASAKPTVTLMILSCANIAAPRPKAPQQVRHARGLETAAQKLWHAVQTLLRLPSLIWTRGQTNSKGAAMKLPSLNELLADQLKDLYSAETQLV